jgi:hypothetical protein
VYRQKKNREKREILELTQRERETYKKTGQTNRKRGEHLKDI